MLSPPKASSFCVLLLSPARLPAGDGSVLKYVVIIEIILVVIIIGMTVDRILSHLAGLGIHFKVVLRAALSEFKLIDHPAVFPVLMGFCKAYIAGGHPRTT